jgi:hypothetical protein
MCEEKFDEEWKWWLERINLEERFEINIEINERDWKWKWEK